MNPLKHTDRSSHPVLCSSLLAFLIERESREALDTFVIHDWLDTVGDRELHQLEKGAFGVVNPDRERAASAQERDIAGMVVIAVGAEAGRLIGREAVIKHVDLFVSRLMLAACAERLRRAGWAHIAERLSLFSDRPPAVTVTEAGLPEIAKSKDRVVDSLLKLCSTLQ